MVSCKASLGVHPPGKGAASELVPSAVVQLGSTCPAIVSTLAAYRSTWPHQSDIADNFHLYLTHRNYSGDSSDLYSGSDGLECMSGTVVIMAGLCLLTWASMMAMVEVSARVIW